MHRNPTRIVQISDIHLYADPAAALLGVKTDESFRAVVELVKTKAKPFDILLLTGDLTQDGTVVAYERMAEIVKPLKVPTYYVPGNHDNAKAMQQVFPRNDIQSTKQIILNDWQIILLDSQKPGAVEGFFDKSQLDFLKNCLDAYPKLRAIIVFHHQPLPVGCKWLDRLGVQNADEFWQLVAQYPMVHTIFFGHVHQAFLEKKQGIPCYALPSTCIQFKPHQVNFALDHIPPGYRWIHLYDDGRIETDIERLPKYVGFFDKDAKGY